MVVIPSIVQNQKTKNANNQTLKKIVKYFPFIFVCYISRKGSLLACGILFIAGAILFLFCRYAESVEMLLIGRLLVGLASGLTTSTAPMYLAEVAPLNLRGPLAVFCSMGVTTGVVFGQVASLQEIFGTIEQWHIALCGFAVLVIICLLPYPWFPESPKYLYIVRKDVNKARDGKF